jgi:hypothetical protein
MVLKVSLMLEGENPERLAFVNSTSKLYDEVPGLAGKSLKIRLNRCVKVESAEK